MTLPIRNSRIRLSQGQIFWREVGQGIPLVFLHGSWTDGSQWLPLIDQLSESYHCVAPDLLGFGDSEWPRLHYSVTLQVECLAEYLEALKLKDVYLIGHSVGAWVAASYALRFPDQVKGLVLIQPEGVTPAGLPDRWKTARWVTGRPPLVYWGLRSLLPVARLLGRHASIYQWLQLRKQLQRSPAACQILFKRRRAEIQSELLDTTLAQLRSPMLLLQGEHDRTLTAALTQAYGMAPYAKLYSIPEADAGFLETMPDTVARYVLNFCGD